MANINKIKLSGTSYDIQDSNAARSVTLTQAQYDALQTKDPNVFYIISDSSISYMTSADTESAITQAVSGKQDTLVSGTNIKTINNQSILGSGNISIQAGGISSVEADYDNTVQPNGEFDILINDGSSYSQIFVVGDGLQVTEEYGNTILSATGGGSITIDPSLDSGSTNAVANSAITTAINTVSGAVPTEYVTKIRKDNDGGHVRWFYIHNNVSSKDYPIYNFSINGRMPLSKQNGTDSNVDNFSLVETSAITSAVTSASTDAQIPSAKAVYDALGGGGGNSVVELTQAEYDALVTGGTVDPDTFYVITDAQEIDTDNYYTTAQTQSAITQAVTTVNNALTAHTADTTIHVTTAQTAAWDAKQNALTIDSTVTSGSTNPVSGGAVYTQFGGLKLVKLTQAQYNALSTKDNNTLYVIVN